MFPVSGLTLWVGRYGMEWQPTRCKHTSGNFTFEIHLQGLEKCLKDWLLPPPPTDQGCPWEGQARWSPRWRSLSPCSALAASSSSRVAAASCSTTHSLLKPCLLRDRKDPCSKNRRTRVECPKRLRRGEGRGGGDLSSADPAHYSPPTTRLTTRQLLRELGLSRFEVRQLPIDTNSLLGSRVGYLCFKLVTWRRWKHQWKLLSLIDGGSRKTRKNYFFII